MNYLGVDYGTQRIGLSTGDDELRFAVPLKCISGKNLDEVYISIKEIIHSHKIGKIIVGYPLNMDGSVGYKAREVDTFIKLLQERVGDIPIERGDERLTSESVGDLRHRSGKARRRLRRGGAIDSAAAVIILQDYFDTLAINQDASVSDLGL